MDPESDGRVLVRRGEGSEGHTLEKAPGVRQRPEGCVYKSRDAGHRGQQPGARGEGQERSLPGSLQKEPILATLDLGLLTSELRENRVALL